MDPRSIAEQNDHCRQTLTGCRVLMTKEVAQSHDREEILSAVKAFSRFDSGIDPYGEHDFGSFEIRGTNYFFKFDYYDQGYRFFQENGKRVLTIGRMDEY